MKRPDPAALRALARRDPRLGAALRRVPAYPGFPQPGQLNSHFHALARSILYQQLAGKAAATIHDRVRRLTPGARFPRAEELLALPEEALRGAGVSGNKAAALRDLAGRVADGRLNLRSVSRLSDERAIDELVGVRGIGVWTAQMFLMFRLGRLDVLPTGDLGVQEGLRRLDELETRPTPAQLEARGARWAPLRTVASWVLWRLADEA